MSTAADRLWTDAQPTLQQSVGRKAFELWLTEIRLLCVTATTVTLGVPSRFHTNYIAEHFSGRIERALSSVHGKPLSVGRFEIRPALSQTPSHLAYYPQRLVYVLWAAREHNLQLAGDAVRYLADRFHTGPQPVHDILFWLAHCGEIANRPLSAKTVLARLTKPLTWCERTPKARGQAGDARWLAIMLDAVHRHEAPVWLAPKSV
jgi:hypothetical protein